ncbi:MAG: type II toxin-antitoxin system antitoxin SocA domain-containing protein [Planctomycetota bacterium]
MTIDDVADYIILQLVSGGEQINLLKLQKLVYYAQAWSLAIREQSLFDDKFQAWVHGPVSRKLYDRFAESKSLYSSVSESDLQAGFTSDRISPIDRAHIDAVMEVYAPLSGSQLEEMTHQEEPWQAARNGFGPSQRCEIEIEESLMTKYYSQRLQASS